MTEPADRPAPLPCPCGDSVLVIQDTGDRPAPWWYYVECCTCYARGSRQSTVAQAVESWNFRRTPGTPPATPEPDPDLDHWFEHPTARDAFKHMIVRAVADTLGTYTLEQPGTQAAIADLIEAAYAGEGTDRGSAVIAFLVACMPQHAPRAASSSGMPAETPEAVPARATGYPTDADELWEKASALAKRCDGEAVWKALHDASVVTWDSGADREFARTCRPDEPGFEERCAAFDAKWLTLFCENLASHSGMSTPRTGEARAGDSERLDFIAERRVQVKHFCTTFADGRVTHDVGLRFYDPEAKDFPEQHNGSDVERCYRVGDTANLSATHRTTDDLRIALDMAAGIITPHVVEPFGTLAGIIDAARSPLGDSTSTEKHDD